MSMARASIIYELEKILKRVRKGLKNIRDPLVRIGSELITSPSMAGQKLEDQLIRFANNIAKKINEAQKSIEESLAMSSLYIGFLITMAIILATVLFYVAGY